MAATTSHYSHFAIEIEATTTFLLLYKSSTVEGEKEPPYKKGKKRKKLGKWQEIGGKKEVFL